MSYLSYDVWWNVSTVYITYFTSVATHYVADYAGGDVSDLSDTGSKICIVLQYFYWVYVLCFVLLLSNIIVFFSSSLSRFVFLNTTM